MYCPKCNNKLPDSATVCHRCGNIISDDDVIMSSSNGRKSKSTAFYQDSVDIIVSSEPKRRPSNVKIIVIVLAIVMVLVAIISSVAVLQSRKNDDADKPSVNIQVSSEQSTVSTESFDDNAPVVVYIKWDQDNYYRKYVINREGEQILSIEHSIGTNSSKYLGSDEFTQEQRDTWVKNYTELFEQKKLDEKYVKTSVYSNSDEVRATVLVPNMQNADAQQYLEQIKMISYYKAGMNYSQLEKLLKRDGYKRKQ